jgi:hypothetical protein
MVFTFMYPKLYDIVICYIWRRSKRREVDRLYREVLAYSTLNGNVRPVDIFLKRLEPLLSDRERRMVIAVKDFVEAQGLFIGLNVRKTHLIRVYAFPKYPSEGLPINFEELMVALKNIYPFIGSARRRIPLRGSS